MNGHEIRLSDLKNVGKATVMDLKLLEIESVSELRCCNPTELFQRLEVVTNKRQDPCVWDVFAAIIHEAKTGESMSWWEWTAERKALQRSGELEHVV